MNTRAGTFEPKRLRNMMVAPLRLFLRASAGGPLDAETDPDLHLVLGQSVVLDDGFRMDDLDRLDAANRLRRLVDRFARRITPALFRGPHQLQDFQHGHRFPPITRRVASLPRRYGAQRSLPSPSAPPACRNRAGPGRRGARC